MALHSVHGPNEDPNPIVDVNATFGEVVAMDRRIFAGEVLAMDMAVANITAAYKKAGLWKDTVLVFSTDNVRWWWWWWRRRRCCCRCGFPPPRAAASDARGPPVAPTGTPSLLCPMGLASLAC